MIKEINLNIAGAELNIFYDNNYSDINNLIGKSFKRNKYGLSLWTDKIKYVGCKYKIIDKSTKSLELYVIGNKSTNHFLISEIVLVNEKANWSDEGYKRLLLNKKL